MLNLWDIMYCIAMYNVHHTVLYRTVLHCTKSTTPYCTVQQCTALYNIFHNPIGMHSRPNVGRISQRSAD